MATAREQDIVRGAPIYQGTRIPSPIPTIVQVDPVRREGGDVMEVNFGPNHPSMHGVLRLVVELDGEQVVGLRAIVGYLHTGFEKTMEQKSWWKAITYPERIDYVAFQNNELVFVLAIEKLLGLEIPPKARWMRTLLCELNRVHSHLIWLATAALELGAISMFWYCFRERERILDLFELSRDTACTRATSRRAASPRTSRRASSESAASTSSGCREPWTSTRPSSIATRSGSSARSASACCRPTTRSRSVSRARTYARRASTGTCASDQPYLAYDQVDFNVPVYENGDVYDRYRVHMDEMRESTRIVAQCLDRLEGMAGRAVDRGRPQGGAAAAPGAPHVDGVAHPPLQDRDRGLPRARGRGLRRHRVTSRRARLLRRLPRRCEALARPVPRAFASSPSRQRRRACTTRSWRTSSRSSAHSTASWERSTGDRPPGAQATLRVWDHRPDNSRPEACSSARSSGDFAVTASLLDEIQAVRAQYPDRHSAVLPALRLAQEPARRLAAARGVRAGRRRARPDPGVLPVGRVLLRHVPPGAGRPRTSSRSARTSAAACAARRRCSRSSSASWASRRARRPRTARSTLRTVECLGGCGWPTVVARRRPLSEPRSMHGRRGADRRGGAGCLSRR